MIVTTAWTPEPNWWIGPGADKYLEMMSMFMVGLFPSADKM